MPKSTNDDDIDFSDIPDSTDEELARSIIVPGGVELGIAEAFLSRRSDLASRHSCDSPDNIDYSNLRPDAQFWREATLTPTDNIDVAIERLVSRRRIELTESDSGEGVSSPSKKSSSRHVSA